MRVDKIDELEAEVKLDEEFVITYNNRNKLFEELTELINKYRI